MLHRLFAAMAAGGIVIALLLAAPVRVATQGPTVAPGAGIPKVAATTAKGTVRHTSDGKPDLQGFWNNTTYTPLERPKDVTKEFYTPEEALAMIRRAADAEAEQTVPGTVADVHYDFTQFGLDRSQAPLALNLRTSLIVDPADGRLPPMTEEGRKRAAGRAEARKRMGGLTDAAQNQSLSVRCILMDRNGPPMLAGAYNNNYQIVQAPGYVMILVEMLHGPRIIPLDARAQLPPSVRQLGGSSRGRWDGDTLVIETTNFTSTTAFQGSSENMRLTERFTRVDEDTLLYRFTVDDPATWTRPWSAEVRWRKAIGPLFEHACHEGNYGLHNILAGARADDKRAAEAAASKTSK